MQHRKILMYTRGYYYKIKPFLTWRLAVIVLCFIALLVFIRLIYLLELKYPNDSFFYYYTNFCGNEYFKLCLPSEVRLMNQISPEDSKFRAITKSEWNYKQFIFVYPDSESKNIINIDYLNLYLDLNNFEGYFYFLIHIDGAYQNNYFWGVVYKNTKVEFDLLKETPQQAQSRLFNEYRQKKQI